MHSPVAGDRPTRLCNPAPVDARREPRTERSRLNDQTVMSKPNHGPSSAASPQAASDLEGSSVAEAARGRAWPRRMGRAARRGLRSGALALAVIWASGALLHCSLFPRPLAWLLAAVYLAAAGWVWGARRRGRLGRHRAGGLWAGSLVLVFLLLQLIVPSNQRNWVDGQQRLPWVQRDQQRMTLHAVRHCEYRTADDYTVRYDGLQFDRRQLESVWLVVHYFSAFEGLAHTFVSFGYRDDDRQQRYFSISAEVRREVGESFSPVQGMYRRFELMLVVGDERDLIGSRTILRPSDRVYLYRIAASAEQVQALFDRFAQRMDQLRRRPEFYHTLTNNCTNTIVRQTYSLTPDRINWLDPRIVMPGYSPRLAFQLGLIAKTREDESFEGLQRRARIDPLARELGFGRDFSRQIRRNWQSHDAAGGVGR